MHPIRPSTSAAPPVAATASTPSITVSRGGSSASIATSGASQAERLRLNNPPRITPWQQMRAALSRLCCTPITSVERSVTEPEMLRYGAHEFPLLQCRSKIARLNERYDCLAHYLHDRRQQGYRTPLTIDEKFFLVDDNGRGTAVCVNVFSEFKPDCRDLLSLALQAHGYASEMNALDRQRNDANSRQPDHTGIPEPARAIVAQYFNTGNTPSSSNVR